MELDKPGLMGSGRIGDTRLARRISDSIEGEVKFDPFSRGHYSTDASHFQVEPIGIVVPKSTDDVTSTIKIAYEEGTAVLPRGGGTSQCGQTVCEAIVIDCTKYLNQILDFDLDRQRIIVEPGLVLDDLNSYLKPFGLWFPVDVSTSSRATIGGMAGNNSCGARSIVYGTMRDNVHAIDAVLADGSSMRFGEISDNVSPADLSGRQSKLVTGLLDLGRKHAETITSSFPDMMRRVGGYNLDALLHGGPQRGGWAAQTVVAPVVYPNLAHLLVGSEGTLAFSRRLELDLKPLPKHKTLGICHFPSFYQAMEATQHIVQLAPTAVELVDRNMIELARDIPMFRNTVDRFVNGSPDALLLVEFSGDNRDVQISKLEDLVGLMGDLGFPGSVIQASEPDFQKAVWEVRKAGLNIMMSMKTAGKPISFIEDCAVRLEDLAEYTARLTEIFEKYGTTGTWYAHASVGCLHVRPVLNLKNEVDTKKMRSIAEAAFAMVREYKGSHSGEHGDGLVRTEFHEQMFGRPLVNCFKQVKDAFDERGILNPGKIVDGPKMDNRLLFRFKPDYEMDMPDTALNWLEWGDFSGAVEMCNNNGACRKRDSGVMCPSFRVTGDEKHLTRGRANSLRLAISGQLGPNALTSTEMADTMRLCVGCKGCKRECPTGVDMARIKVEFLYHYHKRHGLRLFDRLVAYLPRYASFASKLAWFLNLRDRLPGLPYLTQFVAGLSAETRLPEWSLLPFQDIITEPLNGTGKEVVLWADTFTTWFEPENARAARTVLQAAGYRVHLARAQDGSRPLCCGRTFLSTGLVDEARREAQRTLKALLPFVARGVPIVGLEPSCLLTLRDEFKVLLASEDANQLANVAYLFEEFIVKELDAGRFKVSFQSLPQQKGLLHGHCHQKAFGLMDSIERTLQMIPNLKVETINSSCCGMAGAFGYDAQNIEISKRMGELVLFPKIRQAAEEYLIIADGTSCRHQIANGTSRRAEHVACTLERALPKIEG